MGDLDDRCGHNEDTANLERSSAIWRAVNPAEPEEKPDDESKIFITYDVLEGKIREANKDALSYAKDNEQLLKKIRLLETQNEVRASDVKGLYHDLMKARNALEERGYELKEAREARHLYEDVLITAVMKQMMTEGRADGAEALVKMFEAYVGSADNLRKLIDAHDERGIRPKPDLLTKRVREIEDKKGIGYRIEKAVYRGLHRVLCWSSIIK